MRLPSFTLAVSMVLITACGGPTGPSHADNLQPITYQLFAEPIASAPSQYWTLRVVAVTQRELSIVIDDGDVRAPYQHQSAAWDGDAYVLEWPSKTPGKTYEVRLREPGPRDGCDLRDATGSGSDRAVRTWATCTFGWSGVL